MGPDDSLARIRDAAREFTDLRVERGAESRRSPGQDMVPDLSALGWPAGHAAETEARIAPPRLPDEYRVEALIAETNLSRTWRAFHDEHQAYVVVKELHPRLLLDREAVERFRLEVQLISKFAHLAHRNIVPILATHVSEPPYFFSMPLIEGEHLDRYCAEHGLSRRARIELFLRVCRGVAHAHLSGVIHRDLKPNNIIVDRDGEPQLLDFGLARVHLNVEAATSTRPGAIYGALAYMAPEQSEGLPGDVATDVYALGGILYELLTGRHPIGPAPTIREYAERIRQDRPARPRSIDPTIRGDLEAILLKCLEKRSADRYGSVSELIADLECILSDRPIAAWRARGGYVLARYLRRNRGRVLAATVLAVSLVAVLSIEAARTQRLALSRLQAETERHMRAIAHARLLTQRGAPAPAADLLRRELSRHDNLRTRFALWELHRRHPCTRALHTERRLTDVVYVDDRCAVAIDRNGLLFTCDPLSSNRAWSPLPLPFDATCIMPGACGTPLLAGTAEGSVFCVTPSSGPDAPSTCTLLLPPPGSADAVQTLAVTPGESHLAVGFASGVSAVYRLLASREPVRLWMSDAFEHVNCVALTPDGGRVALAGRSIGERSDVGRVLVTELRAGGGAWSKQTELVRCVAFAPDGESVLVGDSRLWLWRPADDSVHVLDDGMRWGVRSILLAPNAPRPWLASSAGDGIIRFYDLEDFSAWPIEGFHEAAVADHVRVAAAPDGRAAISIGSDGLRVWDVYLARAAEPYAGVRDGRITTSVALRADRDEVICATSLSSPASRGRRFARFDALDVSAVARRTLPHSQDRIVTGSIATQGSTLAYATLNDDTGEHAVAVADVAADDGDELVLPVPGPVSSIAWVVPDRLLATCFRDGRLGLVAHDRERGALTWMGVLDQFPGNSECNTAGASRDGRWLAAAAERLHEVRLWHIDAVDGAAAPPAPAIILRQRVTVDIPPWQVAIFGNPDRPMLAVSGAAREVAIYDGISGQRTGTLAGHRDSIDHCLALDERVLITSSRDGSVVAWDGENMEELCVLLAHSSVLPRIAVSDGRVAIATGATVIIADRREAMTTAIARPFE